MYQATEAQRLAQEDSVQDQLHQYLPFLLILQEPDIVTREIFSPSDQAGAANTSNWISQRSQVEAYKWRLLVSVVAEPLHLTNKGSLSDLTAAPSKHDT